MHCQHVKVRLIFYRINFKALNVIEMHAYINLNIDLTLERVPQWEELILVLKQTGT